MRTSNFNNRDYYPDISKGGFSSSKSYTQKKVHPLSSSKVSQGKSKFQNRIQKACPNNSLNTLKKQSNLLKKQIERLQKQLLKKDHRIFQMQSSYNFNRQAQSQLQQTYRIIYMYQGKIQQLEKQLKRLEKKISENLEKSLNAQQIQLLLNEYRNDNMEMRGSIEEQNRVIIQLQDKLKLIQSKYFSTSWKLSNQNRVIANPLKKKFPKLRDTIVIQDISLADRQRMINQLDRKYLGIDNKKTIQKSNNQLINSSNSSDTRNNKINSQSFRIQDKLSNQKSRQQNNSISKTFTFNNIPSSQQKNHLYTSSSTTDKNPTTSINNNYQFYRANQQQQQNQQNNYQNRRIQYQSQSQPTGTTAVSKYKGVHTTFQVDSSSNNNNNHRVLQQSNYIKSPSSSNQQSRYISNSQVSSTQGRSSSPGRIIYEGPFKHVKERGSQTPVKYLSSSQQGGGHQSFSKTVINNRDNHIIQTNEYPLKHNQNNKYSTVYINRTQGGQQLKVQNKSRYILTTNSQKQKLTTTARMN